MSRPADHPQVSTGAVGVLLVNLGTPDEPSPRAVKAYLAEFLSDRRVVEIHPLAWQPILRGIILNTRPKKSAHAYSKVWSEAGSPLAVITAAQAAGLPESLAKGSVVASDAFFPFADGLLAAVEAGATAVIQPGGSVNDQDVIAAADAHGIAMVFTGVRHFRH